MEFEELARRIELYVLSLWLLFFLIILITIDVPICIGAGCTFIGAHEVVGRNVIPLVALFFVLLGVVAYKRFEYSGGGSTALSSKIVAIESEDYEHLTFLTTYIIPLICFDLESRRYTLALLILLIVIGVIYVRTDKYYANPTLAVLGYRLYRAQLSTRTGTKDVVLLTTSYLKPDDSVRTVQLGTNVHYAKRATS